MSYPDGVAEGAAGTNTGPVYIIGFRLIPESQEPDVYTLFLIDAEDLGYKDQPAVSDGRILFFRSPNMARQAAELAGTPFTGLGEAPTTVAEVCDVAALIHAISEEHEAPSGGAEVLNRILDIIEATRLQMPPRSRDVLHKLADYLTFDRALPLFFERERITRDEASKSLVWCLGAAVLRARLLD